MRYELLKNVAVLYDSLHQTPKYTDSGYPMIRVRDLSEGFLDISKAVYVDKNDYDKFSKKYKPSKGDIIFSRVGSYGISSYVDDNIVFCLGQNTVVISTNTIYSRYLYYLMISPIIKNQIEEKVGGSTQKTISLKSIGEFNLPIPSYESQIAIGDFLYRIDKKIELNNQMIATLEELAATLFKRWFVDFEFPDENGNPYKSSGGKMVDSELGEIPEGWEVKSLTQIAVYKNGLAMQKFRPTDMDNSLPVLKIKELNQGFVDSSSDRCSIDIKDDVKVFNGDVIFSWSGTLLVKLWTGGNAGLNQHLFKVTSDQYGKWFYFLWTKHYLNQFVEIAKDKATTMGHIKRENLNNSKVCYPTTDELWKMFSGTFSGLIDKLIELGLENNSLKKTRDSLLPKLLLGELSLKKDD